MPGTSHVRRALLSRDDVLLGDTPAGRRYFAAHSSDVDTGGEFAGPAGKLPFAPLAEPDSIMGAGWADCLTHEQIHNFEFATSVNAG